MAEEKVIETKVKEVDVNIDEIFDGVVTSDSVTLPEEEKSKLYYKWYRFIIKRL